MDEDKKKRLAAINANAAQAIEKMKENALNNPNIDPKLKAAILKLKAVGS